MIKKLLIIGGIIVGAVVVFGFIVPPPDGFFGATPKDSQPSPDLISVDIVKDKEIIRQLRSVSAISEMNGTTKEFNTEERKISIRESDKTLLEAKLLTDYHLMVGAGKETKVAELLLKDWAERDTLFDLLGFYNNYSPIEKEVVFKYTTEMRYVEYIDEESGETRQKILPDWEKAVSFKKLSELPQKNIHIGIYTETILGEKISWVPVVNGFVLYEWADYDVTEIDSLEHDEVYGGYNSLVQIDATHYILAYAGTDNDGYISTFSIDGSYDNITEIDNLEHDEVYGQYNSLVQIDATHYILAYMGDGLDGYIKTFSIDGSYDNITEINSLEHNTLYGQYNSLVQIDATHYILAYMGYNNDGFISTFSIDGSYNITELNQIEHDTANGTHNSLAQIDATHYILACAGKDSDGYISTFSIDGSYNITEIDSLEHDEVRAYDNSLVQIDATHYILAYQGGDYYAYIKTFSIDGSYDNITEIDDLEHNSVQYGGNGNSLVKIDDTHYILAYRDGSAEGYDGHIVTFSIDGSYEITEINDLEHDSASSGLYSSLAQIDIDHYILAYKGADSDGYMKTFSVVVPAEEEEEEATKKRIW